MQPLHETTVTHQLGLKAADPERYPNFRLFSRQSRKAF